MTIDECKKSNITKIKLPDWNEWAYVDIAGDSPWASLYDIGSNGIGMLKIQLEGQAWLPWKEPKNYKERKNDIYGVTDFTNIVN